MTYQEFTEYIKKRAAEELSYPADGMVFYPEGYTSDDPEKLEWIVDCNEKYTGRKDSSLLTDILTLERPVNDKMKTFHRVAVKLLYEDSLSIGEEAAFDKIKQTAQQLGAPGADASFAEKRTGGSYEAILPQLILRPLNYGLHRSELKGCVYKRRGDLCLVLYQLMGNDGHTVLSSKIKRSELEGWGMEGKEEQIINDALANTARLFPACVYSKRENKEVDLLLTDIRREDMMDAFGSTLLSTFANVNGAVALFYPGVAEKLMKIMGGAFSAVFMNINDVMIMRKDDPNAAASRRWQARPQEWAKCCQTGAISVTKRAYGPYDLPINKKLPGRLVSCRDLFMLSYKKPYPYA